MGDFWGISPVFLKKLGSSERKSRSRGVHLHEGGENVLPDGEMFGLFVDRREEWIRLL